MSPEYNKISSTDVRKKKLESAVTSNQDSILYFIKKFGQTGRHHACYILIESELWENSITKSIQKLHLDQSCINWKTRVIKQKNY